ncbi:MAG: 4'-phosphopantetheinyl transferase superfamily protein [Flavobacteriales bacterium]|nr:4'-phosphopantetheinyl transferase superfamily protein [Flavobacteriales bacterium]
MEGRTLTVHCSGPQDVTWNDAAPVGPPAEGMVHLWFATLEQLRPRTAFYRDLLDPVETERAQRFRFKQDRERFILGHGVLRELLGRYLKRDGSLIRFSRGAFGKPYLDRKRLCFNFSDTKDAILVGFTTGVEIGVDIETMARDVDHAAVSEHYFTAPEIAVIQAAGPEAKRCFLDFWTRKEAVLKASGVGIMEDLRVLRVDGEHNVMAIEHEAFVKMAAEEYHVRTWHLNNEHIVSLASPKDATLINFRQLRS